MSPPVNFDLRNPVHFLALGFGSGLIKPAPGTWGTLAAIPLYGLLMISVDPALPVYLLVVLAALGFGVYLCGRTATDVGVHDHSAIVWDEFVGFFIAMTAVDLTLINVVLGFALFRLFDIWKPWPIRALDQSVHGGLGIMIDDVIAGVFACAVLHGITLFI